MGNCIAYLFLGVWTFALKEIAQIKWCIDIKTSSPHLF